VGVDPSCTPRAAGDGAPLALIQDVLRPSHVPASPALVTCRHTLEHVARPLELLGVLREGLADAAGAPLFFEVPSLEWILEHGAFWDFCYEHCNYFTAATLRACLARAGIELVEVVEAFGGQYLWAHARVGREEGGAVVAVHEREALRARLERYAREEANLVAEMRAELGRGRAAVWGMATKGVIFAALVDPDGERLAGGIDVNPGKQGRHAALSGLAIHPPEWARALSASDAIYVMNPNYHDEIRETCARLGIVAQLRPV
jgi:hypothetical protein